MSADLPSVDHYLPSPTHALSSLDLSWPPHPPQSAPEIPPSAATLGRLHVNTQPYPPVPRALWAPPPAASLAPPVAGAPLWYPPIGPQPNPFLPVDPSTVAAAYGLIGHDVGLTQHHHHHHYLDQLRRQTAAAAAGFQMVPDLVTGHCYFVPGRSVIF